MNLASLAIVAGLSLVMLVVFVFLGSALTFIGIADSAYRPPWNLTVTAVPATGGIAALAVFFYGREEAREQPDEGDYTDEPIEARVTTRSDEPPTPVQPDEAQTIEDD